MSIETEGRLTRIERKLDSLEQALSKLDRSFVEMTTEQRVRDQERADERKALLALIPSVQELHRHIDRLQQRISSVEDTGSHAPPTAPPSLPPTQLYDGPTNPGSSMASMLPAYPDEAGDTGSASSLPRETTQSDRPATLTDVAMRVVGIGESLAKGFIQYQRMWGFIVLGVFGPPGLAVGLAQAWMITHPTGSVQPPVLNPVISFEDAAEEAEIDTDEGFNLPGPIRSEAE